MKSVKERLYEYFCRIFRREIIRDGFRGILGRDPEEEALQTYSESLPGIGMEEFVKDLTSSKEAWEKQKAAHAEELIRAAYQGVLGRDPEEEALRNYRESFIEIGTDGVIRELSGSSESWEKQKDAHAEEIIRILYRGILLREPDEQGLAGKAEKIRNQLPWEEIIAEMLRSLEFLTKHQSLLKSITTSPLDDLLEEITDYHGYHIHLHGKKPSRDEIASFIASAKKVWDLKRERLLEQLKDPGSLKVLLIGAYGNGNLGDAYQALAVEQQIKERYRIQKENIFAASHSNVAAFPFAPGRILTREQLMNPDFVNTFGMVVIGGGGILSHPHPPFADKDQWIQSIQIPIIIHAVGAGRKTLQDCRTLILKAVEISGRDEQSITALKEYREDCKHEKDPILMTTVLRELERFDVASPAEDLGEVWDCLWILKYPADEKDREALEVIKGIIGEGNKRHLIVSIEPKMDRILERWFPKIVHYCTRLVDLNRLIRKSEKVVSMRYHGAIFGILNKKTTYGFSQIKIQSILKARIDYIDMDLYKRFNDLIKIK
jgi:hypothetical protein